LVQLVGIGEKKNTLNSCAFLNFHHTRSNHPIHRYSLKLLYHEGILIANFCHQVAALIPNMLCNFYLVKNHKTANNSATIEAKEKLCTYLESLEFKKLTYV